MSHPKHAIVWHPLVHRRFQEELYFFLISAKPFDEKKCFAELGELMAGFGIGKYCAYQIFDQFDILLRIWLPPVQIQAFTEKAQTTVLNLRSIVPFHVTSIHDS